MQLYLSHTSPFGRLCLTRAWLLGRNDLQLHFLDPWQNPPELEAENPFSQIPVLLTDSGEAIYNSHLICQYLDPNMPSAAELSVISYATSLLDNTVQAFKLEKRVGESREHFLVQRSLEAVARALPLAPSFHAAARQWPQMMLGVCLLTLKLRYPELFALRARADTQQAVAVFEQLAFIHHTNPEALSANNPATVGDILYWSSRAGHFYLRIFILQWAHSIVGCMRPFKIVITNKLRDFLFDCAFIHARGMA